MTAVIDRFIRLAEAEASTVTRVPGEASVPGAVAAYLAARSLPATIVPAPGDIAARIDWRSRPELRIEPRPAADGSTVITGCYAGLAEAGALVMLSSADQPTEFLFLAQTHIVILRAADIVPDFETLWARLRDNCSGGMPRTMNLIVGPSRTADLGLPTKLGAHGPARVHVVLLDNVPGTA